MSVHPSTPLETGTDAPVQSGPANLTLFVEGLELDACIGVHPHEHDTTQRIIVDVAVNLGATPPPSRDRLGETVDYQAVADAVARLVAEGHVQLVETLAERIAQWCLEDPRVAHVRVRVAKPQALRTARAAGCILERARVR